MLQICLSIVVPCCNEEGSVDEAVQALTKLKSEVATLELVFVDDGSRDTTLQLLNNAAQKDPCIKVVTHPHNLGLGAAIRTGLLASKGDVVVTTDCDGTYGFDEVPKIVNFLLEGYDLVTASPYHPLGRVENIPSHRLALSKVCSQIYRLILGSEIHTFTSLFRAYRRTVVDTIQFQANGFLGGTELMVRAIQKGFRVGEYPTTLHVRRYGVSKAKLFSTVIAHLKFQLSLML